MPRHGGRNKRTLAPVGLECSFVSTVAMLLAILACTGTAPQALGAVVYPQCKTGPAGGRPGDVYVPMDNWVYPALDRLHALGYLDTAFLGIRPWTRRSIQRMI